MGSVIAIVVCIALGLIAMWWACRDIEVYAEKCSGRMLTMGEISALRRHQDKHSDTKDIFPPVCLVGTKENFARKVRRDYDESSPWGGDWRVVLITRNNGTINWGVQERNRVAEMTHASCHNELVWLPAYEQFPTKQEAIDYVDEHYGREIASIEEVSHG